MEVLKTGNIINLFYLGECDNCGSIIKSKLNELCPEDKYCRRGYAPCPECEKFVNFYSYRNHWLLLLKNESWSGFWRSAPAILFYELKKFAYVLILENSTLRRAVVDIIKLWAKIRKKRSLNKRLTKIRPEEIRQWFK